MPDLVDTELLDESSRLGESFTKLLKTGFFKRVQHDPVITVLGLLIRVFRGFICFWQIVCRLKCWDLLLVKVYWEIFATKIWHDLICILSHSDQIKLENSVQKYWVKIDHSAFPVDQDRLLEACRFTDGNWSCIDEVDQLAFVVCRLDQLPMIKHIIFQVNDQVVDKLTLAAIEKVIKNLDQVPKEKVDQLAL